MLVEPDGAFARIGLPGAEPWCRLSLLAAFDAIDGRDETLDTGPVERVEGPEPIVVVHRRSSRWDQAAVKVVCRAGRVELQASVEGSGRIDNIHLLGG